MKLKNCSHWLHQGCLDQWLKGASTCPVCRNQVNGSPQSSSAATAGRRSFVPPLRARPGRFGLDRLPTREPMTTSPTIPASNNGNNGNTTSNGRARILSGYTQPRTGPPSPSSSRTTPSYYTLRRDRDDDDSPGSGLSGSGTTSSSSTNSFGNFHRFL